ncbi:MAG: hypothetical protein MSB10_10515 [Clostridiales bacterium]|uniref:hypothetical protein n=1 Tax=Flavonifractor porci TaxID=3133422 RepID=UPI0030A62364|nr:hypothetical protein [Clostridiales bacterium]
MYLLDGRGQRKVEGKAFYFLEKTPGYPRRFSLSKKAELMQERTRFLHRGKALGRVLPPAGGKTE